MLPIMVATMSVIDTSSNDVIKNITVGVRPFGIAFDAINNRMFVTNADDKNVSVIDISSNNVTDTITVGQIPFGIASALKRT
jgi:YVTN family beta-propeller protein